MSEIKVEVTGSQIYPYQEHMLRKKMLATELDVGQEGLDFFIAGGALRSVFSREPIADLDIYFPSEVAYADFCQRVMKKEVLKRGQKKGKGKTEPIEPFFKTNNAVSYKVNGVSVQLIKFYFGEPKEIFLKYDFTICMALYSWKDRQFHMHDRFLEHLARRDIVFYPQTEYPISSLWRLKKFLAKGYRVRAVEFIKVALAIHALELNTYADLRHQLEGIDTLFMGEVINALGYSQDKKYEINEAIQFISDELEKKLDLADRIDEGGE